MSHTTRGALVALAILSFGCGGSSSDEAIVPNGTGIMADPQLRECSCTERYENARPSGFTIRCTFGEDYNLITELSGWREGYYLTEGQTDWLLVEATEDSIIAGLLTGRHAARYSIHAPVVNDTVEAAPRTVAPLVLHELVLPEQKYCDSVQGACSQVLPESRLRGAKFMCRRTVTDAVSGDVSVD